MSDRSMHIDISYHFIRDLAEKGDLRVDYIPTVDMVADGMTKPLQRVAFERFKAQLGVTMRPSLGAKILGRIRYIKAGVLKE
jgi:hypothetical protein